MLSPQNKIILGVTGGIAAYKACEIVRLVRRSEAEVRVVMTAEAERFVGALTFASLSGNTVLRSLYEGTSDLSATSHIDLAQWGEILVVAPATANFIAKFANGICDDALLTEALAFQGPILIAPAMNSRMWEAKVTQENVARLRARGVSFIGPNAGELACGETGLGKMAEPAEIMQALVQIQNFCTTASPERLSLTGKKVLITSGPTRAYIDSVRFITNRSSGRMGHALALRAEALGAEVTLVTGPVDDQFATLTSGKVVRVESTQEMLDAALAALPGTDLVFAAAAVCDFDVANFTDGKIERKGNLALELSASQDVLASLAQQRSAGQVFVGFAAQPGDKQAQMDIARRKLEKKAVDFIAMNDVSRADVGFDTDSNEMHVFERGSEIRYSFLPRASKSVIAEQLLRLAAERILKNSNVSNGE